MAIAPASASAACPEPSAPTTFSTSWIGGSGHYNTDANWTNGAPTSSCDASITAAGSYTVLMTAGSNAKSMTIGGAGSTPTLQISAEGPNTNLTVSAGGFLDIESGAAVILKCNVTPSSCGAPNLGAPTISNAGTITVDANVNGTSFISGPLTNTGTMQFNHTAKFNNGAVVNQGTVNIADTTTVFSGGSHCGDTSVSVKNDTGGSINATGNGTFDIINYEQGQGPTIGSNPVQIPCGSLSYTGNGASKVRAYGGFNLTGTIQAGQSLTISPESSNTSAVLQGNVTNNGSITLTCQFACEPNAGAGFDVNDEDFVNAGSFTIAAASGTGAGLGANHEGTITNTGTLQFNQSGGLGGPVTNKGALNVADGKTATSSGSSCGDGGSSVTNDTAGSINGAGSGKLSVFNYVQANGTTSGTAPVVIPCGSLKYTGTGTSIVQVNAPSTAMTGNIAAGQTLRLVGSGGVATNSFTNAGTIVYDQSSGTPEVNVNGGTLVNTGTISTTGPSGNNALVNGSIEQTGGSALVSIPAGTRLNLNGSLKLKAGTLAGGGTVGGSVENAGGIVSPGASPGLLTITGNYVQGPGGSLVAEIEGVGPGEFDRLAVGGNATLAGTLALVPAAAFLNTSAIGESVALLTYGGTRSGQFGAVTTTPALPCPKQLTAAYDDTGKRVSAAVSSSGVTCGGGGGGNPPPATPVETEKTLAETTLETKPKGTIKTTKSQVKVKFTFSSNVAGASFECKLDKGAYAPCASPKSYSVKAGKHTFSVRAVGPGGADASPATFKFKVVKKKPKPKK